MKKVLVLNASYEPLHRVTLNHALLMIHRGVAIVHEADGNATIGSFTIPKVLRLIKYIYARWKVHHTPRWTKPGIFNRDAHQCGYCGGPARTIDHIVPRAQGGLSTWTNTIAACRKCNHRKGSKTLKESGMKLLKSPHIPTYDEIYNLVSI